MREQLAKAFHETQSFKWDRQGGFKLASGLTSPFYVDCRALMAHPGARRLVGQLAYEALRRYRVLCDIMKITDVQVIATAAARDAHAVREEQARELTLAFESCYLLCWAPAIVAIAMTDHRQRLGDWAADTIVIRVEIASMCPK